MNALKALPKKINMNNLERVEMLNQSAIQISIIAFQNDDKDELFNFYDKRGKKRLMRVRNEMDQVSQSIASNSSKVLDLISTVSKIFNVPLNKAEGLIRSETGVSESASEYV